MAPTASRPHPKVPIGIFLAADCPSHNPHSPSKRLPAWHGATPLAIAEIIRTYTADSDLIIDLDAHPTVTAAAWFLHRIPATLTTRQDDQRIRILPPPPSEPTPPRDTTTSISTTEAALILATLPHPNEANHPLSLTHTMQHWRTLLRPGGYLIITPTPTEPTITQPSLRRSIITAAPTAGLRWHQQLLIVTQLPESEPRAHALTAPTDTTAVALPGGRHAPAHRMPLVFTTAEFPEVPHA